MFDHNFGGFVSEPGLSNQSLKPILHPHFDRFEILFKQISFVISKVHFHSVSNKIPFHRPLNQQTRIVHSLFIPTLKHRSMEVSLEETNQKEDSFVSPVSLSKVFVPLVYATKPGLNLECRLVQSFQVDLLN